MDNFDKLFADKVNQTQLPDADQAWGDFVKFRDHHLVAPKKSNWVFSKISLAVIAILLLFTGAIGGYQYAQQEFNVPIQKAEVSANVKVISRKSSSENLLVRIPKIHIQKKTSTSSVQNNSIAQIPTAKPSDIISNQNLSPISIKETATNAETAQLSQKSETQNQGVQNQKSESILIATDKSNSGIVLGSNTAVTSSNTPLELVISNAPVSPVEQAVVNSTAEVSPIVNEENQTVASGQPAKNSIPAYRSSTSSPISSGYTPNSYADKGNVRKAKRFNVKDYLVAFNRYTDVSFYGLENSNDITTEINGKFMDNPANSGIDNRYSISAGAQGEFIQTSQQSMELQSREMYLANSFNMLNNRIGVGLAIQNVTIGSRSELNINMSSAYKISLAKNSQLRLGVGFNSSTLNVDMPDMPKTDLSLLTFNVGARYMFKTLYAQLSINNFMPIVMSGMANSALNPPAVAQMSFGGRLSLSKAWAFHPQLSLMSTPNIPDFKIGFTSSFSYRNKWLVGIQTSDFKSLGIHAGLYAGKRFTIIVKSDIFHADESSSSLMERGALVLKLELGRTRK